MKKSIMICCVMATSVFGSARANVAELLDRMVKADGADYLAARDMIVGEGESVLPKLAENAVDSKADWRRRLAARICYERIVKGKEVKAFREIDWTKYSWEAMNPPKKDGVPKTVNASQLKGIPSPLINTEPFAPITAGRYPDFRMLSKHARELGLRYYFIELNWKKTGEGPLKPYGSYFVDDYGKVCGRTLAKEPENLWLLRVNADRLAHADYRGSGRTSMKHKYFDLLKEKEPTLVPILLFRFDDCQNLEEAKPGNRTYTDMRKWIFISVLPYADARHVELLNECIKKYTLLEKYREKLEEVKKRAPPKDPDPREAFRIGDNPVPQKP